MASIPSLQEFDISPVSGFVPEKEPLQCLPDYFSPWENIARSLPHLVKDGGRFRQIIKQLPVLEHNRLSSEDEWKRAKLVLACISHAYVWCKGEAGAAKILPKCLAVPWAAVAKHLGIPPIMSHCNYALYNWRYIDPSRPLSMDNLYVSVMMTGSSSEKGFVKIPLQVELDFGRGLHGIIDGLKAVKNADKAGLLEALRTIRNTIITLTASFLRTNEVVDPEEFYHGLRPFLAGWRGSDALPDGLIYEGVSETPLQYCGGSAAESSVFQVLDAALGVFHPDDSPGGQFLERMRHYMPPKHRAFIEAVENGPSIKTFVLASEDPILLEEYNQCVGRLEEFRNVHLQIVARFIVIPANKGKENKDPGMALRGTGGSELMSFLKQVRNDTGNTASSNANNSVYTEEKEEHGAAGGI